MRLSSYSEEELLSKGIASFIHPDHVDRVFHKYATHGKHDGQGLGCYLVRLVAEAHGGGVFISCPGEDLVRVDFSIPLDC